MNDLQDQMIELQTRVTFQEDILQQLNQVVTLQDQDIRQLQQQLKLLAKRLDDLLYNNQDQGVEKAENERPPHY